MDPMVRRTRSWSLKMWWCFFSSKLKQQLCFHLAYTPENYRMTGWKTKQLKMYLLLKIVIFQLAVLVFAGVLKALQKRIRCEIQMYITSCTLLHEYIIFVPSVFRENLLWCWRILSSKARHENKEKQKANVTENILHRLITMKQNCLEPQPTSYKWLFQYWMIPNLYIGNGCLTKHPF